MGLLGCMGGTWGHRGQQWACAWARNRRVALSERSGPFTANKAKQYFKDVVDLCHVGLQEALPFVEEANRGVDCPLVEHSIDRWGLGCDVRRGMNAWASQHTGSGSTTWILDSQPLPTSSVRDPNIFLNHSDTSPVFAHFGSDSGRAVSR